MASLRAIMESRDDLLLQGAIIADPDSVLVPEYTLVQGESTDRGGINGELLKNALRALISSITADHG